MTTIAGRVKRARKAFKGYQKAERTEKPTLMDFFEDVCFLSYSEGADMAALLNIVARTRRESRKTPV